MGASEQQENDAERVSEKEQDSQGGAQQPASGIHEVPLFLRGASDGPKGNAQDEKDEVGE
jgi:hypothetical protein